MVFTGYFIFVALLSAASANPLGQTTVCESTNLLPALHSVGTTTVCESAPTFPIPPLGLGYGYLPYPLGVDPSLLPYSYLPIKVPHTTVIDSTPAGTTVCDSVTSVPVPATTVCESVPNVVPVAPKVPIYHPRPYPGLFPGLSVSPFGVNLV